MHSFSVLLTALPWCLPQYTLLKLPVRLFPAPLLNRLHKLIHLPDLLVTHLLQEPRIKLVPFPAIAFELLPVLLPLRQEADDVQRVVDVFMAPELGFDVRVAEEALLGLELLAVDSEQAAVEGDWGQNGEGWRGRAGFEGP